MKNGVSAAFVGQITNAVARTASIIVNNEGQNVIGIKESKAETRRQDGQRGAGTSPSFIFQAPAASWSRLSLLATTNPSWPSPEVPLVPMGTVMQKSLEEHYSNCKCSSKDAHPCSAAGKKLGAFHAVINKAGDSPVLKKAAGAYG